LVEVPLDGNAQAKGDARGVTLAGAVVNRFVRAAGNESDQENAILQGIFVQSRWTRVGPPGDFSRLMRQRNMPVCKGNV
jgi:hypothetical protein